MPTSSALNISRILGTVIALRPQSVLDVGIGTGKTGFLLREYLDVYFGEKDSWPPPRRTRIDGVEAYAPYIGDIQRAVYDKILIGNAAEALPKLPSDDYDLVLMIDVLEHFVPEEAELVVREARRVGKYVLAVSPAGKRPQEASYGNAFEQHRLTLTRRSAHRLGFDAVQRHSGHYFASSPSLRTALSRWRVEYFARTHLQRLPDPLQHVTKSVRKKLLRLSRHSSD